MQAVGKFPIVQSEVLYKNDSLSSAYSVSNIHDRVPIFSGLVILTFAASLVPKTGTQLSDCNISTYEKMRTLKNPTVNLLNQATGYPIFNY